MTRKTEWGTILTRLLFGVNLRTIIGVLIHLSTDDGTQKHKKLSRRSQVQLHVEVDRCEYPLFTDTLT